MALSNIFREPRREIIETLVGVGILSIPVYLDYRLGSWFFYWAMYDPRADGIGLQLFGIAFSMLLVAAALGLGLLAVIGIHELGDSLCDALDRRGLRLRPKQRW